MMDTIYWHDYETFGVDPRRDRPVQFAGQRTTLDLEPVGPPLTVMCRQTLDYLPHPGAALVTGLTPQQADREGISEAEFAEQIVTQLGEPGTCGAGYNSLRFDDEVTRFLLFRSFYDPYEREWKNGNSRWDLIDVVRLCYALRPDGLSWPQREDGKPSFRLEHLTAANDIAHEGAHDALADVRATIGLAQRLRRAQPRLFDYAFSHRGKRAALAALDYVNATPVLHVSARYSSERGCLALVAPVCQHPDNSNGVCVVDLAQHPEALLSLSAEDIADRVFTPSADLPEGIERIGLKTIAVNKAPVLAPVSVLKGADLDRINLDPAACQAHRELLLPHLAEVAAKVRKVFSRPHRSEPNAQVEWSLYGGSFPSDRDRRALTQVRRASPTELADLAGGFDDPRYAELLFAYRARNFPDSLSPEDGERWIEECRRRLTAAQPSAIERFGAALTRLREERPAPAQQAILDAVDSWGRTVLRQLELETWENVSEALTDDTSG
ncbi:MAG: exodeoxyribonuclease I [Pseudomonadota bacterium]